MENWGYIIKTRSLAEDITFVSQFSRENHRETPIQAGLLTHDN